MGVTQPQVLKTVEECRAALALAVAASDAEQPVIGLVPTMGALHSGHGALFQAARRRSDVVLASIFVNALQFDDPADYEHYPRTVDDDVAFMGAHGVDLIFAPSLEEMYPGYPEGPLVRVSAGELGRRWEGASRPGHFDGVATVVTKLLTISAAPAPARLEAWFGQKDAEQLAVIRRMVADLNLPVTVCSLPIVRDENGLALSSRNQRLSESDYDAALNLSRALSRLAERAGSRRALGVGQLRAELRRASAVELDYLVVVDPLTLLETTPGDGHIGVDGTVQAEVLALIAATVGPVRLIDNMFLRPPA